MRRLLMLAAISSISMASTGCTITREADGLAIHAVPWHLRDGTYRPWNDVNSGSLSRWRGRNNLYGSYQQGRFPY